MQKKLTGNPQGLVDRVRPEPDWRAESGLTEVGGPGFADVLKMASKLIAMVSNLLGMASNQIAMVSNQIAMSSNLVLQI